ncbi:hypothetical protein [Luteipulveratus halotolerans]|uniref:hypothetical protein n=1 Tax=Luteipulveratus halotolerans TaxID=1631356 RepID=UPI000683756F|nr:hypothetical protein [Luteipulveratus halotolerans]
MPDIPLPNPFSWLAGEAGKVVVDGWTMAMLGLWNAGLWLLRVVLTYVDAFMTPDLSENGPGAQVYQYTFWIAGSLVVLMLVIQMGVAAVRRDGKSIATAVMGTGQFMLAWSCWISGAVLVLAAAGGLTRALMTALLKVNSWSAWKPFGDFSTKDITDGTVATVLGGLGCLLWLAAIGHLLVMLTRAGALLVLATTTPISAAGLVSDTGRPWFWKSLRWFIAAAFSPVVMVLVLGVGVQLTTGVANGQTDGTQKAIASAVPGVLLILISTFCPLALFKLLAFVDPGTTSGAALRAGLEAQGGLQGLLSGKGAGDAGSSAASTSDENGTSQGEASGEDATTGRFTKAEGGMLQAAGGALGAAASTGLGAMEKLGTRGAAIGADVTNQMGVGHSSYYPDFSSGKQQKNNNQNQNPERHGDDKSDEGQNPTGPNPPGPDDPSSSTAAPPTTGQHPGGGTNDPSNPSAGNGSNESTDPEKAPTSPGHATQGPENPAGATPDPTAGGSGDQGDPQPGLPGPQPGQAGPPSTSPGSGEQGGQSGGKSDGGSKGGGAGGPKGGGPGGGAAGGAAGGAGGGAAAVPV